MVYRKLGSEVGVPLLSESARMNKGAESAVPDQANTYKADGGIR